MNNRQGSTFERIGQVSNATVPVQSFSSLYSGQSDINFARSLRNYQNIPIPRQQRVQRPVRRLNNENVTVRRNPFIRPRNNSQSRIPQRAPFFESTRRSRSIEEVSSIVFAGSSINNRRHSIASPLVQRRLPTDKKKQGTPSSEGGFIKCPICFESIQNRRPVATPCGHLFCTECIQGALEIAKKCPLCVQPLHGFQLLPLYV